MADMTAKPASLLLDFAAEVKKGFIEDDATIHGYIFHLATPTEDDEVWADNFIRPSSSVAIVSARRVPRLATAIKSVKAPGQKEPVATEALFTYPDDMPEEQRKFLDKNPTEKRYWVYTQMMVWLSSQPSPVVMKLYDAYDGLIKRRNDALKEAADAGPNS